MPNNANTIADVEKIRTALQLGPDSTEKIAELLMFDKSLADAEKARGIREMNPSEETMSDLEKIRTLLKAGGNLSDAEKDRSTGDER